MQLNTGKNAPFALYGPYEAYGALHASGHINGIARDDIGGQRSSWGEGDHVGRVTQDRMNCELLSDIRNAGERALGELSE